MEYKKLGSDYNLQQCPNDMGDNFHAYFAISVSCYIANNARLFPEVTPFCVNDLRFITKVWHLFVTVWRLFSKLYRESFA